VLKKEIKTRLLLIKEVLAKERYIDRTMRVLAGLEFCWQITNIPMFPRVWIVEGYGMYLPVSNGRVKESYLGSCVAAK
jgi:hypothetical protein